MQEKCIVFVFLRDEILGQHAEMGMGGELKWKKKKD